MGDLFDFKARPTAYAVIGNPVEHSRSPDIHTMFAKQCDVVLEYTRIQVDIGGFGQAVSHFQANGGGGLNVTVPFKGEAWELCLRNGNRVSAGAEQAQAVNTLKFENDGSISGDNTDGPGLVRDIEQNLATTITNASILLVGAGGASSGVIGPLLARQPDRLTLTNRTRSKATELASRFGDSVSTMALDQHAGTPFDIVINATAASLAGSLPGIDPSCIGSRSLVYDMMYQPQPTIFMKWALEHGAARAVDGLGMLVEQAAGSFYIWHGAQPQTGPVIAALRKN